MHDDIYFKAAVLQMAQGLLAAQQPDMRYIDQPNMTRYEHLAKDAVKYAEALIKELGKRETE